MTLRTSWLLLAALALQGCGVTAGAPAPSATPTAAPAAPASAVIRLPELDFGGDDGALAGLASWVGDAEMVLLGESHHGDAEGIAATVRIIRFLHERMGFDLLALEADLYGCDRAYAALQRGEPDAAALCAFRKDAQSRAAAPFWDYVAERARTAQPLELAGFDCQPSSQGSRTFLVAELASAVAGTLDAATWQRARAAVEKLSAYTERKSPEERELDRAALAALADALARLTPTAALPAARLALLRQMAESLAADEAQEWAFQQAEPLGPGYYHSFNGRDAQMADNLLWLRAQHPGRRIVVWAATAHLVRKLGSIPTSAPEEAPRYQPMGQHIAAALGARALHIGTLHTDGTLALPGDAPFPLPAAPEGFVEAELARRGFGPRALIDLRRPDAETAWLDAPLPARWYLTKRPPTRVPERPADVVDLLLFLEHTRPNEAVRAATNATP